MNFSNLNKIFEDKFTVSKKFLREEASLQSLKSKSKQKLMESIDRSLNERDWKFTIPGDYRNAIFDAGEEEDFEGVRLALVDICKYVLENIEESDFDLDDQEYVIKEFRDFAEELDYVDFEDEDEANYYLNELYDLLDNTDIFLGLREGLNESSENFVIKWSNGKAVSKSALQKALNIYYGNNSDINSFTKEQQQEAVDFYEETLAVDKAINKSINKNYIIYDGVKVYTKVTPYNIKYIDNKKIVYKEESDEHERYKDTFIGYMFFITEDDSKYYYPTILLWDNWFLLDDIKAWTFIKKEYKNKKELPVIATRKKKDVSESLNEEAEKFIITKVGDNLYALAQGNPPIVNDRKKIEANSFEEAKEILLNNGYTEDELVIDESLNEEKITAGDMPQEDIDIIQPLIDDFDSLEDANKDVLSITWNFGRRNSDNKMTAGVDIYFLAKGSEENLQPYIKQVEDIILSDGYKFDDSLGYDENHWKEHLFGNGYHTQIIEDVIEDAIDESLKNETFKKGDWVVVTANKERFDKSPRFYTAKIADDFDKYGIFCYAWIEGERLSEITKAQIVYKAKNNNDALHWITNAIQSNMSFDEVKTLKESIEPVKPTKEQFKAYVTIQKSGITNMFDVNTIRDVANDILGVYLDKAECLYIYKHYDELMDEYKDEINTDRSKVDDFMDDYLNESLNEDYAFRTNDELYDLDKEINDYLNQNGFHGMIELAYINPDDVPVPSITYEIYMGDWKHEHLFFKQLIQELMEKKNIPYMMTEKDEDNGSDTYTAYHTIHLMKHMDESLTEDTVKQDGKWVNKGKEGTHGEFKTKKEADAQRRAMFANGFKG